MAAMNPNRARKRFLDRLQAAGLTVETLTPSAGIDAMLAFYEDERADGCDPEQDGDMLLFQWGAYDWGGGPAFEVDITRQFLAEGADEPRQLSLTFRYPPETAPPDDEPGNQWCDSPGRLTDFRQFVAGSEAVRALGGRLPIEVVLRFSRV
jgi:hypothetical protein